MSHWSDDELRDDEYPDEEDAYDEEETLTTSCPACGAEVYEDAEQCPVCGNYITHSTSPWQGRSPLWIVLGTLGALALLWTLLRGGL
jgi:RNA polymerase subunit RPABC4/transcription elongation factor Spt4